MSPIVILVPTKPHQLLTNKLAKEKVTLWSIAKRLNVFGQNSVALRFLLALLY